MWGEGVLCFMIKHNNIRDIIKITLQQFEDFEMQKFEIQ